MTFYWFGDSWVFGDELEKQVGADQQQLHTFANLVSEYYQADCINLSACGSSINAIPLAFNKIVTNIDPTTDRVFFFLTAEHRNSMFDEHGQIKNITPSVYKKHNVHQYQEQRFKYFDNSYQRTYNYDCMINLLYHWCKNIGVTCYFSNIFTTKTESIIDCVPDSSWLLPKNKCIAEYILPLIDNDTFSIIADDNPKLTNEQWRLQQPYVEKYIRPCHSHPNQAGHQKIAQEIIKLLTNE